jgi:predicted Zn-dependent protease
MAWGESTDSELTVTARTLDGTGSGWSGQAHRDWTQIQPERLVHEAIDLAQRSQHPVRVEPGKYTAILSADAVGALVAPMSGFFHIVVAASAENFPFGYTEERKGLPPCRLGERVFDPRISLWTDPADPECGDFPFFPDGIPSGRETWVKDGVLRAMAYDTTDGPARHKTPVQDPVCVRMSGGTTSIAEMIATCERGIYVHRFSSVIIVDKHSGTMSGVTRDGCFLIKDGKIAQPIINFRFYQSPVLAFNNVLALGVPQRVSFGFAPPARGSGRFNEALGTWPRPPMVLPPMMVHDFNFAALVDAV